MSLNLQRAPQLQQSWARLQVLVLSLKLCTALGGFTSEKAAPAQEFAAGITPLAPARARLCTGLLKPSRAAWHRQSPGPADPPLAAGTHLSQRAEPSPCPVHSETQHRKRHYEMPCGSFHQVLKGAEKFLRRTFALARC